MVRIGDFESLDPGSIPGKTSFLDFVKYKWGLTIQLSGNLKK